MQINKPASCKSVRSFYAQTLSIGDLYGGKICAALDRQHPRDLFDVYVLFNNEGITEDIRKAFLVYLISHPRPIIELLNPTLKDFSGVFEHEFKGMTTTQIELDDLVQARLELIHFVKYSLSERERQFLLSVKQIKPRWELLELQHIKNLPAVQWKLLNLKRMDKAKHSKAVEKLRSFLEI
ncbi:MAG: nucleotidyl transferase AbiEii/AbiGii toxin family protein [bacterium]